ncbi:serine hydrolase [Pedobacter steynii]|nr:serine hydrolase [Pedobacter steynii]
MNFTTFTVLRTVFIFLLTAGCSKELLAQEQGTFISNGKSIDIYHFDLEITKMIKEAGIPAVSLAIIDQGKIAYKQTYGVKEALKPEEADSCTVFEACSLSKSFLVYATYQLVDQGKLDLDKPLYQYLEPGPMLDHDPRYRLITPRMVLSHSSGLEDWPNDHNPKQMDIISTPGQKFYYSSLGYNYLGAVIESIQKEPYDKYLEKLVLSPLQLKNTFSQFKSDTLNGVISTNPVNFAYGHDSFGKEFPKWKNYESSASSGISTTAEDYARLLLATFDRVHLKQATVKQILTPVVPTGIQHSKYFYGTGFEILNTSTDTIIGHGGSNPGFKAQMFYSVVNKRGLVFLTNSDLGKLITSRINELTTKLGILEYYQQFSVDQYPSKSISLLNLYKLNGVEAMFLEVKRLRQIKELQANTLNQLGQLFLHQDTTISRRILEQNIRYFPNSAYAHLLLGDLYKKMNQYEVALKQYKRAKQLNFKLWDISPEIDDCLLKIKEKAISKGK